MARSSTSSSTTTKDAQALFQSLRSAYAATPTNLKIIDLYVVFAIFTAVIQGTVVTEEGDLLHDGKEYLETRDQLRYLSQEISHGLGNGIVGIGQSFVPHRIESNLTVTSSLSSGKHNSLDGLNPAAQFTPQDVNTRGLPCPDPITECILDKLDRLLQKSASQRKRRSKQYERVYRRKKIYKALQRLEVEQRAIEFQTSDVDVQVTTIEETGCAASPILRGELTVERGSVLGMHGVANNGEDRMFDEVGVDVARSVLVIEEGGEVATKGVNETEPWDGVVHGDASRGDVAELFSSGKAGAKAGSNDNSMLNDRPLRLQHDNHNENNVGAIAKRI